MNTLKKFFAITICIVLSATCLAGCHKNGEIAVTAGDIEFTSGYYACAFNFADMQARDTVDSTLSEEERSKSGFEYYKQKIEGMEYEKWVKQTALDDIRAIATYKTLCQKSNIELDEDVVESIKSQAKYMWDYAYGEFLSSNGVAYSTYEQYLLDDCYADRYFEYLYGEGGSKEINADELSNQLQANYQLVNMLEVNFSSVAATEIDEIRNKFVSYETDLKNGKKTFEQVYLEYNEQSAEDHHHDEPADGESAPQDYHATVLGYSDSSNTNLKSDYYDDAKALAIGEVKLITLDDDAGLVLLVKKDISADPYYLNQLDLTLRKDLKTDEYQKELEEEIQKLELKTEDFATNRFKAKNIEYPTTNS